MTAAAPAKKIIFEPTPKQAEFQNAILSGQYRQLLFGGAMGGGKSAVLVAIIIALCRIFPGSRWAIIRKDLPRIKKNLIPTWRAFAPSDFFGPINKSDWNVKATNGSEVLFFAASEKDDPNHDRLRGLEVSGAGVDECNEISLDFFHILGTRVGRWKSDPRPPPLTVLTCNPTKEWPKAEFYDPWTRGELAPHRFYLPALPTENPHLTPEYLETLEDLPPQLHRQLVLGDWTVADEPDQLIKSEWVEAAFNREPLSGHALVTALQNLAPGFRVADLLRRLGVDVARFGDDASTIARTLRYHVEAIQTFEQVDTKRLSSIVSVEAADHRVRGPDIRVDTVGVGSGVADNLNSEGYKVAEFIGGASPTSKDWEPKKRGFLSFKNLRTEAWWHVRELHRHGIISYSPDLSSVDKAKILGDLTAPRYTVDDKVVILESKDKTKARLGRSPDHGDAIVEAFAVLPRKQFFFV